jgi:L-ascorbate metabolism protein UlaG (beta-lactamase superfamily)
MAEAAPRHGGAPVASSALAIENEIRIRIRLRPGDDGCRDRRRFASAARRPPDFDCVYADKVKAAARGTARARRLEREIRRDGDGAPSIYLSVANDLRFTYIGGPTALIEFSGIRFLTDPGFDPAGTEFRTDAYVLERTSGPAVDPGSLAPVDVVLLSHDHHFDNLDGSGRQFLPRAGRVLTTKAGAGRLGGNGVGLDPWESVTVPAANRTDVVVTATPARHGPADGDRGPVIGFVLHASNRPGQAIYISGDTVWYEGVEEVARRFQVRCAFLFMGAARVAAAGPHHLTLTSQEGVKVARAMPEARIIPLHYEGWRHFSEGREDIEQAFSGAGLAGRLLWGEPGAGVRVAW